MFLSPLKQSCGVCKKRFANVYRLQRHMISHDESAGLRRFKCADCGKAFKFKHHLKVSFPHAKNVEKNKCKNTASFYRST